MLKQVNICTLRTIPRYSTENILTNKNFFNARMFSNDRANILSSEDIFSDISGAVYSGEYNFLGFNINTNIFTGGNNYVTENLQKALRKITDMGEDVKGFICGGLSNSLKTKNAAASYALYNQIAEIFDNMGIPFGMICGKNNAETQDNIRMHRDTIFMWGNYLQECFSQKTTKPITRDNLPDFYDDVIMPEDISFSLVKDIK